MKYMVLVGALVMTVALVRAEEPPAKDGAATAASTPDASAAWAKVKSDLQTLQQSHDNNFAVPKQITTLLGESGAFATKFPDDPNAWNATMLWAQLAEVMNKNGMAGAPSAEKINHAHGRVLAEKNTPVPVRGEISAMKLLGAMVDAAETTGDASAKWQAVEKGMTDFQKEFGTNFSLDGQMSAMGLLREKEITLLSSVPSTP
jgi:hypothetical protein